MHPDLHRYLDGELSGESIAPELRSDTEVWEAILEEAAGLCRDRAPAWLEARVMGTLPPRPKLAFWRRAWRWFLEPRQVRVRPVIALIGAAAALVLVIRPAKEPAPAPIPVVIGPDVSAVPTTAGDVAAPASDLAPPVYIQFVFAGGDARSVALAGDFNGWNPERHVLRDPDGDGVWTGLFALPPGLHKYMFLVDGDQWVTDPRAERYVDDGFGMRNALINVAAPAGRSS